MAEFILMLTRNDLTVPNAQELLREALNTRTQHIGFKDVGLPLDQLRELVRTIKGAGRSAYLEVVSLNEDEELKSARVGLELGVDYLIGGTRWRPVSEMIAGSGIKYFPYVGDIIGHPAQLGGDAHRMVAEANDMSSTVDGINLLAFRHVELEGLALLRNLVLRSGKPVICAGSIDSIQRVSDVTVAGAWGFTVGKAALDGAFAKDPALQAQIDAILAAAAPLR